MMSRVKQFFTDFTAPFHFMDEAYLRKHLSSAEYSFFQKLRRAERLHSIEVAKITDRMLPRNVSERERAALIKAALLHDIGKYRHALGPFQKTFMVIFRRALEKPDSLLSRTMAGDIYLNHPQYSMELLQGLDSFPLDPWLYDLVLFHHKRKKFLERYPGRESRLFLAFCRADDES